MTRETNAAAFLEAKKNAAFEDLAGDVFEAHTRLDEFKTELCAHVIYHGGRGQRLDHLSGHASVLDVMPEQKADDLVGGEWRSVSHQSAHSVGVPIGD